MSRSEGLGHPWVNTQMNEPPLGNITTTPSGIPIETPLGKQPETPSGIISRCAALAGSALTPSGNHFLK